MCENLCVVEEGKIKPGPARTHVDFRSVQVNRHHQNWRLQGIQRMLTRNERNLFFTFPMNLSESDAEKFKKQILLWISNVHELVAPSPSQVVRCLNIDFFEF